MDSAGSKFPLTEDLVIASLQEAGFSVLERNIESMPLKKDRVWIAVGVTGLFVGELEL